MTFFASSRVCPAFFWPSCSDKNKLRSHSSILGKSECSNRLECFSLFLLSYTPSVIFLIGPYEEVIFKCCIRCPIFKLQAVLPSGDFFNAKPICSSVASLAVIRRKFFKLSALSITEIIEYSSPNMNGPNISIPVKDISGSGSKIRSNVGSNPAKHFKIVVFPVLLFPKITVHCAGLPSPSEKSISCLPRKHLTFSMVNDLK